MGVEITITDALVFLDPEDDSNWTQDGLPRMGVLEKLLDNKDLNRQDVTDADPEFDREKARAMRKKKEDGLHEHRSEEAEKAQEVEEADEVDTTESLDQEIAELQKERSLLDKEIDSLVRLRDKLEDAKAEGRTEKANMHSVQEFIKSQHKLRAERAQRSRLVMQVVGKTALDPLSKLDRAFARKTARGTRRPPVRRLNQEG